jgi:hypothetical protein
MSELTVTGNGILLKGERMVLPESLQDTAVELAHRGAHPGQTGLARRLRYHFFFHGLQDKVKDFVEKCNDCSLYVDKKTSEPIQHHQIPEKVWDTVAVDLYGPMPSSKHVVVAYDLLSRFPAAKLVSSTKAEKVIPALENIYDTYGNPQTQISDNGPPFNSVKMKNFTDGRNITMQPVPPRHPNANPSETFMRPLGKTLKIGHRNHQSEAQNVQEVLNSYRQTPHPSTGIPPADMMFRDGLRSTFPRRTVTDDLVAQSRQRDLKLKMKNEEEVNSSKYRQASSFRVGDRVLVRNYKKSSKFDPLFLPEPFVVTVIDGNSNKITIQAKGQILDRHPDDIKLFHGVYNDSCADEETSNNFQFGELEYDDDSADEGVIFSHPHPVNAAPPIQQEPRRSNREKTRNPRYFNDNFQHQ